MAKGDRGQSGKATHPVGHNWPAQTMKVDHRRDLAAKTHGRGVRVEARYAEPKIIERRAGQCGDEGATLGWITQRDIWNHQRIVHVDMLAALPIQGQSQDLGRLDIDSQKGISRSAKEVRRGLNRVEAL